MNALDIVIALEDHELVAVDARGDLCRCGVRASFMHHYVAVALEAADAPGSFIEYASTRIPAKTERALRRLLIFPDPDQAAAILRSVGSDGAQIIHRHLEESGLAYLLPAPAILIPAPHPRDARIIELWREHRTDSEIAARIGVDRRRVLERRQHLGLPSNAPRGGQRKVAS